MPESRLKAPDIIDGREWFLSVTRNMSFWHQYLNTPGSYFHTRDFGINASRTSLFITIDGTKTYLFFTQKKAEEYDKAVIEAISSKKKVNNLRKMYFKHARNLLNALENCKKVLNPTIWKKFIRCYEIFAAGLNITLIVGRAGSELLVEGLRKYGIADKDISHITGVITYPEKHTPLFNSELKMIEIAAEIQKRELKESKAEKKLKEWVAEFGHIPVNFCDEPWTIKDAKKQLKDALKGDCTEELKELSKSHTENIKKAKELLKKINNDEISALAYALAEGTYLNEFRKNIFSKVSLEYRPLFKKIAAKVGSKNWRDVFYLTPQETIDILDGVTVDIKRIISERKIAGAFIGQDEQTHLLDLETAKRLADYVWELQKGKARKKTEEEVVKGFGVSVGIIKGIAKIILSSKDFYKLKQGDILVAVMTSVDYVPIMAKAAAFVTNEGGITCHASIVAREMGKPCIVGTKNGTRAIKDGDLVEVDANNGIVKIIKRS